ncbi:hypothetical protein Bca101_032105 [Brassica carinata]
MGGKAAPEEYELQLHVLHINSKRSPHSISFTSINSFFQDSVKDSASISFCTAVVGVLHFLMMFLFVSYLGFEVKCIALSGDVSNFNLVAFLFISITFLEEKLSSDEEEEVIEESYEDSVREWKKLSGLAIPSFGLVCLELWFYEMMILIYWCL